MSKFTTIILSIDLRAPRLRHSLARTVLTAVLAGTAAIAPGTGFPAELGRLFLTPQQRQDLDRRRASNAQAAVVTADDLVTVNGHVARSSGKTTTWINGAPQDDAHRVGSSGRISIKQGDELPSVSLKVGETLDRVKGETRNRLEGGTVQVGRERK